MYKTAARMPDSILYRVAVHEHRQGASTHHCCAKGLFSSCRLQNWPSVEVLPAALHRQRHLHKPSLRRANSAELPPLRALPPPITLNSQPAVDVDLNLDYQSEVAPFLGQCLVRKKEKGEEKEEEKETKKTKTRNKRKRNAW